MHSFKRPFLSSAVIPPLLAAPPNQALGADQVAISQQERHVDVERAIGLWVRQEVVDRAQRAGNGVCRRPGRLEEIEAYLASLRRR